jgi:integrase
VGLYGERIAVRFAYEWHDDSGHWFRSYGNENWEFDAAGLMQRRFACITVSGRVFPIDQNVLKMRYRRAVARAPIAGLSFHDLRHIGTSRLAKLYPNPLDLKRVTGHKDLKSLDRYHHTTAEELAARLTGWMMSPQIAH